MKHPIHIVIAIAICSCIIFTGCQKDQATIKPQPDISHPVFDIYDTSNSGLPFDYVSNIVADKDNNIWMGVLDESSDGALVRFDGTNWEVYTQANSPLPSNNITSLACDQNNKLWIGTSNGLVTLLNGQWETIDIPGAPLYYNQISAVKTDLNNAVWILSSSGSGYLFKYDGENWTNYSALIPVSYVFNMCVDNANHLWFGAETPDNKKGIFRFDGAHLDTLYLETILQSSFLYIRDLNLDYEGNVWILGQHNFPGYSEFWYKVFDPNMLVENTNYSDLSANGFIAFGFTSTSTNQWAAGGNYNPISGNACVKYFNNGVWKSYDFTNSNLPGPSSAMYCICSDHNNKVWIGGSSGLFKVH